MTDLTNAPAWVREIAERASKATEGPWAVIEAPALNGLTSIDVASLPRGYVAGGDVVPRAVAQARRDREFIAAARADVPRLIQSAAGMAEYLEWELNRAISDSECWGMCDEKCSAHIHRECDGLRIKCALAKWRGEVGE